MANNTIDMALMDIDMGSVEAAKNMFDLPPEGTYSCVLNLEGKKLNDVNYLEWKFKVVEPIELNDPSQEVAPNATFSFLNGLAVDKLGFMKVKCSILAEALGCDNNLAALVENVQNVQVTCMLKHRRSGEKVYASVPDAGFAVA